MLRPTAQRPGRGGAVRRLWAAALLLCLAGTLGCPMPADLTGSLGGDGVPLLDKDGNFTFGNATKVALAPTDRIIFDGQISGPNDLDLYDLGELGAGDHILVDVQATGGNLDATAALFDARQYVHAFNDDRAPDSSDLNPRIDVIIRGPTGPYYLGIAGFPGSNTAGPYRVSVVVQRGAGVPEPPTQIVYLNYRGGQGIVIRNVGVFDLPPFDAAELGERYAGQTDFIKDRIEQIVLERYTGFRLLLLNSDDHPVPGAAHSTIYFGAASRSAFAISEQIDTHNADPGDNSIIFTGSYRGAFAHSPTVEEMALALGNTVAHEIGHLLGLVHTRDCRELMDTTCGNDSLLIEQTFGLAPLDDSVFPVGLQNAPELLAWILGTLGM